MTDALLASLLSGGLATALGALPVLVLSRLSREAHAGLLGFAGGVMLAAAFQSLIAPGLELAAARWGGGGPALAGVMGLGAGAATIALVHALVPHEHFEKGVEGGRGGGAGIRRAWLLVLAITLHNLPEGLSVGVGVATGQEALGLEVALAIGLQNLPEGLIVAVSLFQAGYPRATALGVAVLSGLVEPAGAVLGHGAASLAGAVLPLGLLFAGGAMIYVVSGEVIPESHRHRPGAATAGAVGGVALLTALGALLQG